MVLLARGSSHRTTTDVELVRWGADVARIEGHAGDDAVEVALVRPGSIAAASGARKRIRVNGVAAARGGAVREAPGRPLRARGHAPGRRVAVAAAGGRSTSSPRASFPRYAAELATYGRALQQRNGLLRAIRDETASREELRYWDRPFLDAGGAVVATRHELLGGSRRRSPPPTREIAPEEASAGALGLEYVTNAPAGPGRDAPRRPGPAACRDRREGDVERHDARRAASGRRRVRDGRPGPRRRSPRGASSAPRSWP